MAKPPVLTSDVADRPGGSLSTNDALVDLYMERAIDLIRLESGTRNKVFDLLNQLESDLVGAIAKVDPSAPAAVRYQQQRLQKLLTMVQDSIRATYRDASTLLGSEIREVADVESTWTGNAINAAIQLEAVDASFTRSYLNTLVSDILIQGAASKDWWARQAGGLSDRFADEMRRGLALGEANDDLVARTRGLMDVSRNSAERLVRATVQTTANAARDAVYGENADIIKALLWHSTLDTRTSEWCIVRDGLQYTPVDHKPIGHDVPWLEGPGALHWGCRSTSIPVLKTWRDLGVDEDEVPHTTRASMDGQVPAQTSFEAWLKKQSQARQDTVLGQGKADLWRAGKISFRDLLDQGGRPLTTEELRAKAARG